jgi:hypothetical protein
MKTIRGTKDAKGVIYQKQPTGGTGRTVCMKCGGICIVVAMPNGKKVLSCQGCRAQYSTVSMTPVVKEGPIPRKHKGLPRVGRR